MTPIPNWACNMWNIQKFYKDVFSKNDPKSIVYINFQNKTYKGWITVSDKKRKIPFYRLWFEESLTLELKYSFLMMISDKPRILNAIPAL